MAELVSQLLTPELQVLLIILLLMLIALYVLSIVWVIRDANQAWSYLVGVGSYFFDPYRRCNCLLLNASTSYAN